MKIIKCLKPLLIFFVTSVLVSFVVTLLYINIVPEFDNQNTSIAYIYGVVAGLILIPIFIKQYYSLILKEEKFKPKYIYLLVMGMNISLIYNILVIFIYRLYNLEIIVYNNYFILFFLSTGIIGPILEEYLFRGLIFNKLREVTTLNKSILISVLIFALLHVKLELILMTFLLGLFLTYLYLKEESVIPLIIFHIGFNAVVCLSSLYMINLNDFLMAIIILINLIMLLVFGYFYMKKQQ